MPLDPRLLRDLDEHGYSVLVGVLSPAEVARLCLAFERSPTPASGTQHITIDEQTPEADAWAELRVHPRIGAIAEHLLGLGYIVRDLHGRNPLPGFGQQGLHADWPTRAPGEPPAVLTALWMLDDFTVENGATRVVPGSHRELRPLPRALAQPLARHPDERVITGAAGSVLVFNGHLWHAGRQNQSARSRRTVQMVVQRGGLRPGGDPRA